MGFDVSKLSINTLNLLRNRFLKELEKQLNLESRDIGYIEHIYKALDLIEGEIEYRLEFPEASC